MSDTTNTTPAVEAKATTKPAAKRTTKASTTKAPAKAKAAPATTKAPAKGKATPATTKVTKAETKPAAERVATSSAPEGHPGHTWLAVLVESGLSQTQAANEMQVAPMTLNRLINGKGIPTANVTIRFAAATKTPVKKLWDEVAAWELAQAQAVIDAEKKSA